MTHATDPPEAPQFQAAASAWIAEQESNGGGDVWIFGFGSLIHTPGFEYDARIEGYIKGWRRVWWQGSTDHRGTPSEPGRTVTLAPDHSAATWGAAYRIPHPKRLEILTYLEWREKQYDLREKVDIYPEPHSTTPSLQGALCYIATSDTLQNINYLGPAPLKTIAKQIAFSKGPSGPNYEYLYKLADAMRHIPEADEELFLLETEVRAWLAEGAQNGVEED